jgi:glucose/arabinose dehydrogenase
MTRIRTSIHAAAFLVAAGCATTSSSSTTSTSMSVGAEATPAGGRVACATALVGVTLPAGFCATVFADTLGAARHMTVAPNGDVFVAISNRQNVRGGVIALRDADRDGQAEVRRRFGDGGNTGIALANGSLYLDAAPAIVRYPLAAGQLEPSGPPDTLVTGLPTGGHGSRVFAIDGSSLLVVVGSRTNACQVADRQLESPGVPDCPELQTRAGIWQFDANRLRQTQSDAQRFATGIRNAVAFTKHPTTGALYVVQHGRDNFVQNWPKLYDQKESAEQPSEEFLQVTRGSDYGWPFCYHDRAKDKELLAPEYGGDKNTQGRCASATPPIGAFPGHWGPNDLLFYTGSQFPAQYRGGAFIAFHGSWNRDPEPQGGYNVVFVRMENGKPAKDFEVFADGFAGETKQPRGAAYRPTGLAQGPDGSLYISDDVKGRIWKVMYVGGESR